LLQNRRRHPRIFTVPSTATPFLRRKRYRLVATSTLAVDDDGGALERAGCAVHSYVAGECDTLSIEWWHYLPVVQLVLESKKFDRGIQGDAETLHCSDFVESNSG